MTLSIEQWSAIVSALIAVVGVFFTVCIGFKQFRENKWCENVSKERTIWLKEFRQEVGKIMKAYAYLNCLSQIKKKPKNGSILLEAEEARYVLITRINTNKFEGNEFNFRYKEILKKINFSVERINEFPKEEFLELTNIILEEEWKKVKKEAKNNE